MRGADERQMVLVATTTPEGLVPKDHPIRLIKKVVDDALLDLSPDLSAMYSDRGRPSIAPEQLLKSSVLMALYSIRSERQFCERLRYDLLFKYFLHLNIDDVGFDHSTFSKNRERLLSHQIADKFFHQIVSQARFKKYASGDQFSADGTLLESWASIRSLKRVDGGGGTQGPIKGESLKNSTHCSTTDPEARLLRKTRHGPATLCFMAEALVENENGLVVDFELVPATGTAEREAALRLLGRRRGKRRASVAADKLYDTKGFVKGSRELNVTPHVAQIETRRGGSAIDGRTTRHQSYKASQKGRKRVEEVFGWMKTIGGCRKLRYIGLARNRIWTLFSVATYNIVRITKLDARAAPA